MMPPPVESLEIGKASKDRPLVFISHDSRDAQIAEAFANLLSDVSAGMLKSFRSSDKRGTTGIEFGADWYASIMGRLADATDVVALLTPRSLDRPWILYEAGVAKGKLNTTVLGIALGVPLDQVSTGPFGQFQNSSDDEDSLTRLVMQLLQRNPDAAPREEAVRLQVRLFREALERTAQPKREQAVESRRPGEDDSARLFEEVKAMVRDLPERIRDARTFGAPARGSREYYEINRRLLDDFRERVTNSLGRSNKAAAVLVALSFVREPVPWLYELGSEIHRTINSNDIEGSRRALEQFEIAVEVMLRATRSRQLFVSEEEQIFLTRYVPDFIDNVVARFLRSE